MTGSLKQTILNEAHRLGFVLAGVTIPDPPPHFSTFENWLAKNHHGDMHYLSTERSLTRRANPKEILPECKSILVLGTPYNSPPSLSSKESSRPSPYHPRRGLRGEKFTGKIAAYALGDDYHNILPPRLDSLIRFIEGQAGHSVANRAYTDTGPLLERDLAQRAGLGWIGKNTCLIHPQKGSYFLLAEILLDLELEPDPPFVTDHCGTCTRCIDACPTRAITPHSVDASRCISYLTIEHRGVINTEFHDAIGGWLYGCDVCQEVCPHNSARRAGHGAGHGAGDATGHHTPIPPEYGEVRRSLPLLDVLDWKAEDRARVLSGSAMKRATLAMLRRNAIIVAANTGRDQDRPRLIARLREIAGDNAEDALVRETACQTLNRLGG